MLEIWGSGIWESWKPESDYQIPRLPDSRIKMAPMDRRDFLKLSGDGDGGGRAGGKDHDAGGGAGRRGGAACRAPPMEMVRIGYVGIGGQGGGHVSNLLKIPGCRITAVCDMRPERTDWATKAIIAAGHPAPTAYTRGPRDFERLCETEELDLVFNATPWEFHVPIMLSAMRNGKHTATEVPAAMTVEDCWAMVESAEKHQKHCVMMENCNYDRAEMMVYNMVRQGLFGEILHAEGGYLHDLRGIKFEDKGEGLWRRAWAMKLNGNLYPTHGLGPVANCLDINRGDRFDSPGVDERPVARPAGLGRAHVPADSPKRKEKYVLGDVNTSLIKTAQRPDDRRPALHEPAAALQPHQHGAGHQGAVPGLPNRVYIEGRGRERPVGRGARPMLRGVRAPAVEGDRRAREGRRTRRHGLHRGLPPDQVPARRARRPT